MERKISAKTQKRSANAEQRRTLVHVRVRAWVCARLCVFMCMCVCVCVCVCVCQYREGGVLSDEEAEEEGAGGRG